MYNLEKILPHKPPMILLDDILEVNLEENTLTARFDVTPQKVFYEPGGINSLAGIEFMAQAIGCYAYFSSGGEEPKPGLLLGTRLYNNLTDYFEDGKSYLVKIHKVFGDDEIVVFDCLIYDNNNEEIASATVNAYQGKNIRELIKNE